MTTPSLPPRRRRRLRIVLRAALVAVIACVAFVFLWGTTITVTPPASVADPVHVLLIADDRHRGLVLPAPRGGYVELGFGSWSFYALGEDAWYQAVAAALVPSRGTLSRRTIRAVDPAGARAALPWATFQELRVSERAARELLAKLEASYGERRAEERTRPSWDMTFVPARRSYWLLHNCTDAVADWLRELGCAVSWAPVCLDLRVR